MSLTFLPRQPLGPIPAGLRSTRDVLFRDAWDHPDHGEQLTAVMEASALVVRLRQIAAECEYPEAILSFAEAVEDAAAPLESAARNWDDDRDGRQAGNRLDNSRNFHPRELGGA